MAKGIYFLLQRTWSIDMDGDIEPDFIVEAAAFVKCHDGQEGYPKRSLRDYALSEAFDYKWIESEKAKCNLGFKALESWFVRHWPGFLRARWLDHLKGTCFWIELSRDDFGVLVHEFGDQKEAVEKVAEKLLCGAENLTFVLAYRENQPVIYRKIVDILIRININLNRILPDYILDSVKDSPKAA